VESHSYVVSNGMVRRGLLHTGVDCSYDQNSTGISLSCIVFPLVYLTTLLRQIPFIQSIAAWPLLVGTATTMVIAIALPYSPLRSYLQMVPLPAFFFAYLAAALLCYCVLFQVGKFIYIRLFGEWLGCRDMLPYVQPGGRAVPIHERSVIDRFTIWLASVKLFSYCM
jgi:magnesium-transporting ATPase (P-type)